MTQARETTRLYIKIDRTDSLRRFVNVVALHKEGRPYEYKVTFEGIKGNTQWTLLRNAIADARIGIRRIQDASLHEGEISVGYHADGNVMVKVGSNFKPCKYPTIDKLKKPRLFLRVSGFSVSDLHPVKKLGKEHEQTIVLFGISKRSHLTCDFYLSRKGFGVSDGDPLIFKAGKTYGFTDSTSNLSLHIHIYKTQTPDFYVVVPKTGLCAEIEKRVLYFYYSYIYRVMGWKQTAQP